MKLRASPGRLRLATGFFALCVPIAALQTVVISRAPWWKLPYRTIELWALAVLLVCLPLAAWINQGRRWALYLAAGFGAVWCALSAWVGMRMRNPSIGFFTVFLMMYWVALVSWLRHEMGRSFFDPNLRWYQGLPKPIPGLSCELRKDGAQPESVRVSRIDADGLFVFSDRPRDARGAFEGEAEMRLHYRDREVSCRAVAVRKLPGGAGAGYQFSGMSPDAMKSLGDFVETLRGEGHV